MAKSKKSKTKKKTTKKKTPPRSKKTGRFLKK
jgi:hypothetical protein